MEWDATFLDDYNPKWEDPKCLRETFHGGVKQARGVIYSGKDLSVILKNQKEYVVRNILK